MYWHCSYGTRNKKRHVRKRAIQNRPITTSLIFQADRGVQYAANEFTQLLKRNPLIKQSMSRKGNCWEDATASKVAESFFRSLKSECVSLYSFFNRNQAAFIVFEYIEKFYNRNRRHSALGALTIIEVDSPQFYQ